MVERTPRRRRDGSRTSDLITLLLVPHPEPIENAQPDTLSDRPEPTRHPVQTNPTPCPKSPDTMTGLTTFEAPEEPSGDTGRAKPGLDQKACDLFWEAYPEAGRVNFARSSLPIALGRHVARLRSVERLIGAARNYAAAIRKAPNVSLASESSDGGSRSKKDSRRGPSSAKYGDRKCSAPKSASGVHRAPKAHSNLLNACVLTLSVTRQS